MWAAYHNYRTITTLEAVLGLTLQIRRCLNQACPHVHHPHRPEQEGRLALPKHEFGLDVIAFVGQQRYGHHRSVPEIHQALVERHVAVAPRTVTNLLERYDELVALSLQDTTRLQRITQLRGRIILALDGLQPDVGHEVLWVLRDCLSGEVLLARSLLSATHDDLAHLVQAVQQALQVPIVGVITDGQPSIRAAVAQALPGVPHQLCQFHYLREAAKPISEADRHAKTVLKSGCVASGPSNGNSKGARTQQPRSCAAIVALCAVRSPMMAAHLWAPQVLPCRTASVLSPRASSGWKKGGLAQGVGAPEDHPPARVG
jgi:hypothetical protein